jgi:hypothetical protein
MRQLYSHINFSVNNIILIMKAHNYSTAQLEHTNDYVFNYLLEQQVYGIADNPFSGASNFFNTANYLLTFTIDFDSNKDVELYIQHYQSTLLHYLQPSLSSLRNLYLSLDIQNFFAANVSNNLTLNMFESSIFSEIYIISNDLSILMKNVTANKNDIYVLREIFPQFEQDMYTFEILSYDDDGTLYEDLSTPDLKLYYPEPFVASPSFVHEDV